MSGKPNIKSFSRIYRYLQDPALRTRETGDTLLTIEGAEFSGLNLQGLVWRHVKFVNCDFAGAYEIKLDRLEKSTFDSCKFVGIHGFGDMVDVTLHRCAFGGETYVMGYSDSKRLVFDDCNFVGTDSNRNHWGAVGGYGEAEFVRCKGKWFDLSGLTQLVIRDCEFETVSSKHDPREVANVHAPVLIERSKLRGTFNMVASSIQSLTIRDTVIDALDLTDATIKGEVTMERIRAGKLGMAVASGQALSMKAVTVTGNGQEVFYLAANRFASVLLENCALPDNLSGEKPWMGGAQKEPAYQARPPLNKNLTIRKSKASRLDASYLNTAHLVLDGSEFNHLDLSYGRIGLMEMNNTQIGFSLDLTHCQVNDFKQTGGTSLKSLGGLKIDGSNIKLPR
ncbi:hypothetical protein [Variovorax sp. YR752]|uniref:hypothetical protein n=1 Tax=Variovorax sp. YR752 TaxID=1884383 RepID=UPI0031379DE6